MTGHFVPQWLDVLRRRLGEARVPVRELWTSAGQLSVQCGPDDDAGLTIMVTPLDRGGNGWGHTQRFTLRYRGARDLEPLEQAYMRSVQRVLLHLERHLPAHFDLPCGWFSPGTSDDRSFQRMFPFCTVEHSTQDRLTSTEVLVRTTARCNQNCPFCSAPPPHPEPTLETVKRCLDAAASVYPGSVLTLTGGEPTLRADLSRAVRHAVSLPGVSQVLVQTNAVVLANPDAVSALDPDPRLGFFVSLHALTEAVYDRCTRTQGQFDRALAGLGNLLRAGHHVTINCVVSQLNLAHLRELPTRLAAAATDRERLQLHFSTLICPEHRPEASDLIVSYRDVARAVQCAAESAEQAGLRVSSLRSSTHASLPACLLGEAWRELRPRRPELQAGETGYEDPSHPWVKAVRCRQCRERNQCLGVPRAYADKLGLDELVPITGN